MSITDIYFVVPSGAVLLDLAGPAEAFRIANSSAGSFALHFVGAHRAPETSIGIALRAIKPLPKKIPTGAVIFLLGSLRKSWSEDRAGQQKIVAWLARSATPEVRICSVCSGALLLAAAGLLDGRHCTTHHTLCEHLAKNYPFALVQRDRIFVQDGNLYTSAGITAGIDLALFLIGDIAGAQIAAHTARELVVYFRRTAEDPQLSPWVRHRNHLHPGVHRVQDAILREPTRVWTLAELADHAYMSVRNLTRMFRRNTAISLTDYQQSIRVAYARQLLSTTATSIEQVAQRSGFASARHFRRVWKKFDATPPVPQRNTRLSC